MLLAGLLLCAETLALAAIVIPGNPDQWQLAADYAYYRDLGARWLSTGEFYFPRQLAGSYAVQLLDARGYGDVLYPPTALLLFVPFALLPAVLWWAIPLGFTGYVLYRFRPPAWAWLVMLALLAWPRAIGAYLFGNTDIWMVAGIAAGLRWGWPVLIVTMKPTLAPFVLLGIRHRSWWLAAALGAVFVVLSSPLWMDYVMAMRNVRGLDLGYNLGSLPLMLIPLVAYVNRIQSKSASTGSPEEFGSMSSPAAPTVKPGLRADARTCQSSPLYENL
jgi:hypothetical protein